MATDGCLLPGAGPSFAAEPVGIATFLLIGLLGGAHCLGMCGPLVTAYADRMAPTDRPNRLTVTQVRQHGLFNLGRATSYALLGGLFGLAGELTLFSMRQVTAIGSEIHAVTGLLVGIAIVAVGIGYLRGSSAHDLAGGLPVVGSITSVVHDTLHERVDEWVGDARIAGLGAVHGLLPCPLLYPAFLYAFVQSSAVGGAVALGALGIGTIPSLFLYGTLFGSASATTRARLHRLLGVAFIVLGYIPIQHALVSFGIALPHPPIPYYQPL